MDLADPEGLADRLDPSHLVSPVHQEDPLHPAYQGFPEYLEGPLCREFLEHQEDPLRPEHQERPEHLQDQQDPPDRVDRPHLW